MADLIRRSWQFILGRLSTSTLSVVLFSVIVQMVFGLTSVYKVADFRESCAAGPDS